MNSPVPATLVSRAAKTTFLVTASALVLGTQEAMNTRQRNQGTVLKVTDLISLKCTVRSTFPEAYFTQGQVALGKPWNIGGSGPTAPIRTQLCDPVLELRTKSTPLIKETALVETVHNRVHLGGVPL